MGKDQRGKHHGLDLRRNRQQKARRGFVNGDRCGVINRDQMVRRVCVLPFGHDGLHRYEEAAQGEA